jgi:autotransporter-associated beta strand protein
VLSGGAKIDTDGKDITIGQALLAPVSGTSGGLTKSGGGTLTLSNTNTYTGATTVNGGILNITGSTHANSAVNVGGASASGTPKLTGSGTINGAVTVKSPGAGGRNSERGRCHFSQQGRHVVHGQQFDLRIRFDLRVGSECQQGWRWCRY